MLAQVLLMLLLKATGVQPSVLRATIMGFGALVAFGLRSAKSNHGIITRCGSTNI
jgi:predicted membrane metal-binding protein